MLEASSKDRYLDGFRAINAERRPDHCTLASGAHGLSRPVPAGTERLARFYSRLPALNYNQRVCETDDPWCAGQHGMSRTS